MRNPVLLCYWNWVIATISERVPKRHYFFFTAALCRFARTPKQHPSQQRAEQPPEHPAAARARLAIWGPALPKVSGTCGLLKLKFSNVEENGNSILARAPLQGVVRPKFCVSSPAWPQLCVTNMLCCCASCAPFVASATALRGTIYEYVYVSFLCYASFPFM